MSYLSDYRRHFCLMVVIAVLLFVVTACGRTQSSDTSASQKTSASAPAAPTMPSGQFKAVGEQSVLTTTANLTVTTISTQAVSLSADLARGEAAYSKNKCGDCHGVAGDGVAEKGKALAEMGLSLEEFDSLLRTGGGLGNSHIFGRSAVSPSGMEALYAYVHSFE